MRKVVVDRSEEEASRGSPVSYEAACEPPVQGNLTPLVQSGRQSPNLTAALEARTPPEAPPSTLL